MKPTFLLFHAENVNEFQNSICHLILIPVNNGEPDQPKEFFLNPEAPFDFVMSGITADQIESFAPYTLQWPKIQEIFDRYDMKVCSAEGYSAHSLYNTLVRLNISFSPFTYCNAKAICRRTLDEVSYSLDFLSSKIYNDIITSDNPLAIARRWCDLALKGLVNVDTSSWQDFFKIAKIRPGLIAFDYFVPSLCLKDYSKRKNFDPSTVDVNAQPENPFYGMNVVFTGKMESMTREEARTAVLRIGGIAPDRLTQDTDYLVVGKQDLRVVGEKGLSGKMKTAEKYRIKGLPIEIIDEADFIEMLGYSNIYKKQGSVPLEDLTAEQLSKMTELLEEFRNKYL